MGWCHSAPPLKSVLHATGAETTRAARSVDSIRRQLKRQKLNAPVKRAPIILASLD
jgi:hypothetical protein